MPVTVIDALEVVDVRQNSGQGPLMATRAGHQQVRRDQETAPVANLGQLVGDGLQAQPVGQVGGEQENHGHSHCHKEGGHKREVDQIIGIPLLRR